MPSGGRRSAQSRCGDAHASRALTRTTPGQERCRRGDGRRRHRRRGREAQRRATWSQPRCVKCQEWRPAPERLQQCVVRIDAGDVGRAEAKAGCPGANADIEHRAFRLKCLSGNSIRHRVLHACHGVVCRGDEHGGVEEVGGAEEPARSAPRESPTQPTSPATVGSPPRRHPRQQPPVPWRVTLGQGTADDLAAPRPGRRRSVP